MAGFGYAGWALIENIKKNIEQKRSIRIGKESYSSTKRTKREFDFPDISKEELEKIKTEIRLKGKLRRRFQYLIMAVCTITLFVTLYIYLF